MWFRGWRCLTTKVFPFFLDGYKAFTLLRSIVYVHSEAFISFSNVCAISITYVSTCSAPSGQSRLEFWYFSFRIFKMINIFSHLMLLTSMSLSLASLKHFKIFVEDQFSSFHPFSASHSLGDFFLNWDLFR